jgi:ankyrin repeat protein
VDAPPPPPPPLPDGDDNDNGSVSDGDDNDNGSVSDGDDDDNGSVGDGDDDEDRALFHAVLSQNARTLKALLVTESSRINDDMYTGIDFDRRYWTLLHLALIHEDELTSEDPSMEIVQILLNVKGLNVNKKDSEGKTPLMVAKGVEFVKLLLGHRDINVNERDNNGSTALWLLANLHGLGEGDWPVEEEEEEEEAEHRADTLEIAQLLIDAGADVNIRGADKTTPLEAAEKRGFTEYVEKFSKIKRRLPFAKTIHSIKGINEDTAKMKVLQNEDLQREIRKWLG